MASQDNLKRLEAFIPDARSLYVSGCAAEIVDLPALLEAVGLNDACVTGVFSPLVNRQSYGSAARRVKTRTFLLPRILKSEMADGLVEFCPWRYSVIDRWLQAPGRFDTAIVMLSPPDENGMCSFGPQADFLPSFHEQVGRIIGFINPNLPRTSGHPGIPYGALSAVIDYDRPLLEMTLRPADAVSTEIAGRIALLVPDGATVQVGTGQLPSEVLAQLADHRNLSVHTGIVDDNILALEASGALAPGRPIVTGTAVGTRRLYDEIVDARRFALTPTRHTHNHAVIAGLDRFTAINSVLQIDLFGQVSGEAIGGRIMASPGGLPDFVRGAQDSSGGQAIIAVRARSAGAGRKPGVVALINDPGIVTTGAVDAHVLVTEFGAADVRGLSMDKRAEAIMGLAAPEDRDGLAEAWRRIRDRLVGGHPQLLKTAAG